jgi:hypothetical protein
MSISCGVFLRQTLNKSRLYGEPVQLRNVEARKIKTLAPFAAAKVCVVIESALTY